LASGDRPCISFAGLPLDQAIAKEILGVVEPAAVEAVVLTRICPDDTIAGVLTRNGLLTGTGNRWTRERVVSLRKSPSHPLLRR
jgi:hypothetical protein